MIAEICPKIFVVFSQPRLGEDLVNSQRFDAAATNSSSRDSVFSFTFGIFWDEKIPVSFGSFGNQTVRNKADIEHVENPL